MGSLKSIIFKGEIMALSQFKQKASQNGSVKMIALAVIIIAIILIIGVFAFTSDSTRDDQTQTSVEQTAPQQTIAPDTASDALIQTALQERSLGDANAPIVMEDYSSLTCPHCARFHLEILPQLKRDYIDTGKLRFIYKDFPLNLPALQASAVSRCVQSDDAYFAYLDTLFETQAQWGGEINAKDNLIQTLEGAGLSQTDAEACLNSRTITTHLLTVQNDAKNKYNIDSTPYFVLNEGATIIRGGRTLEGYKEEIDALLETLEP